ncbi:MAG: hypothetical protein AAGK97_05175, partial [Bacteroidota bacterium]
RGGTANTITIDSDVITQIRMDLTVQNDINIIKSKAIEFLSLGTPQTVTINGDVINNTSNSCELLPFKYGDNQDCTIHKDAGILNINNVCILNIKTSGGASFNANNSIVYVTPDFWNITNVSSNNFYWIGGNGQWSESTNWSFTSGGTPITTGCTPSIADNVIIDNNSFGTANEMIEILNEEVVNCNTLFWSADNYSGLGIAFPSSGDKAILNVGGNIYLDPSMTINSSNINEIAIWSNDMELEAPGVNLPRLVMENAFPVVNLLAPLQCDFLEIFTGSLYTNNFDITTEDIQIQNGPVNSINLYFGSSTITVNGSFDIEAGLVGQVFYDADEASIICENFDAPDGNIKSLKFINSFIGNGPRRVHHIEKVILAGGEVAFGFFNNSTGESTIDTLILDSPDAHLRIRDIDGIQINHKVISASATAKISGQGSLPGKIVLSKGLCISDSISFKDIEAIGGPINAPLGIDEGGNSNITFQSFNDQGKLYWIGGEGDWNDSDVWSFASGACPVGHGNISDYDSLIFDNNSFLPGDNEIFFSGNRNTQTMLFKNTDVEAIINLPFRLRSDRVYVDGGLLTIKDLSPAGNRELHVNEELHIINDGELTLDTVTIQLGLMPDNLTKSTLKVDATGHLDGKFSVISINGHGPGVSDYTVDFSESFNVFLGDCILTIQAPLVGQSQNDMRLFIRDRYLDKFQLNNPMGTNQKVHIESGFLARSIKVNYGILSIDENAQVFVEE